MKKFGVVVLVCSILLLSFSGADPVIKKSKFEQEFEQSTSASSQLIADILAYQASLKGQTPNAEQNKWLILHNCVLYKKLVEHYNFIQNHLDEYNRMMVDCFAATTFAEIEQLKAEQQKEVDLYHGYLTKLDMQCELSGEAESVV